MKKLTENRVKDIKFRDKERPILVSVDIFLIDPN